jgi:hypothetical protein
MGSHHFRDYLRKGSMFRTVPFKPRKASPWTTKYEAFRCSENGRRVQACQLTWLCIHRKKRIYEYFGETVSMHPPSVITPKLINTFHNKLRSRGTR